MAAAEGGAVVDVQLSRQAPRGQGGAVNRQKAGQVLREHEAGLGDQPGMIIQKGDQITVITSYSIHYTKLYELVVAGVRRLVVAGGETSGAVISALGVTSLRIGHQIDPGVPWTETQVDGQMLAVALKSGNFGTENFFSRSFEVL